MLQLCFDHRHAGAQAASKALVLEAATRWKSKSKQYRDDTTVVVIFLENAASTQSGEAGMGSKPPELAIAADKYASFGFPASWVADAKTKSMDVKA